MAKRENLIAELREDNFSTCCYGILIGEESIFLTQQKKGEAPTDSIKIDREDFDKIVRWYVKKQRLPKRKVEK